MAAHYPMDERTKGNRLAKRSIYNNCTSTPQLILTHYTAEYDATLIHGIINETPILHVSFNAAPKDGEPQFPTVLPMLGAVGSHNDNEPALYLHGSSVARLFRLTANGEIPLCACATIFDGYVLSLTPFHNSCNYRSAVCFGMGSLVTDPEEVTFALKLITNNSIPERWENSRTPPTNAEITSTGVLKMAIETASSKHRVGGPNDERSDLQNPDVIDKTWIGVVPAYTTLGEPIATEHNKVKQVPEYLADWVADVNSLNEQRAVDAVDGIVAGKGEGHQG